MVVCLGTVYAYIFILVFRETVCGVYFCAIFRPLLLICESIRVTFFMVVCIDTVYSYIFILVFRETVCGVYFCAIFRPLLLVCESIRVQLALWTGNILCGLKKMYAPHIEVVIHSVRHSPFKAPALTKCMVLNLKANLIRLFCGLIVYHTKR